MDYRLIATLSLILQGLKYCIFGIITALIITLIVPTIQINIATLGIITLLLTNIYIGLLYIVELDGHQQAIGLLSAYAFGSQITEDNVDEVVDKLIEHSENTNLNITVIDNRKDKDNE